MFHFLTGGEHAGYQPATYLTAINYAKLSVLAFAILLLLWPGRRMVGEASL
jgi:hypothetical protein